MKLQPASRKELKRIALGTGSLDLIMVAGLFLLSQFGIGSFDLVKILISALCGSAVAIFNFALMCLTVQSAVGMQDMKKMKAKFQLSYNARMILQAGWAVIAFLVPGIHFIAGAAPVLFPKITILYLQFTGKLLPPDPPRNAEGSADSEDAAESEII
jgi:hypothetical protein